RPRAVTVDIESDSEPPEREIRLASFVGEHVFWSALEPMGHGLERVSYVPRADAVHLVERPPSFFRGFRHASTQEGRAAKPVFGQAWCASGKVCPAPETGR